MPPFSSFRPENCVLHWFGYESDGFLSDSSCAHNNPLSTRRKIVRLVTGTLSISITNRTKSRLAGATMGISAMTSVSAILSVSRVASCVR